jgi:hypothetical protein
MPKASRVGLARWDAAVCAWQKMEKEMGVV